MPPFTPYSHYLAYGSTDQETFRELREAYDGVLVPATIAAWQRQGTGGFVLSLSATPEAPPYMIDPRFPLFQQGLTNPKKSHIALAELLGDTDLIHTFDPSPDRFNDQRLAELATAWVGFNRSYGSTSNEKFDKYAERLGEEIAPTSEQAQAPEAILAPYFACDGVDDPWWPRSRRLFEHAQAASDDLCLRVVCARHSGALAELLEDMVEPERLVVWVSGLDEHNAMAADLVFYRDALDEANERGHEVFALYGGFFSVLLGNVGLRGAAHGVGFSEHPNWRELPESGAPPPRYYLRRAHRYVPQDLAQAMWNIDPTLTHCECAQCLGREPIELAYHELMKHSVCCRAEEIDRWYGQPAATVAEVLETDHEAMTRQIRDASLVPRIRSRALNSIEHLPEWVKALRA